MKKTIYLFALAGLTLAACGDNTKLNSDGNNPGMDGSGSGSNNFPAAPALGAQIDRMGRPAISTALLDPFLPASASGSDKDAYNQDANVPMWQQTWVPKFAPSLAAIDSLDTGVCGNGFCENYGGIGLPETNVTCPLDCPLQSPIVTKNGCGNVPLYAAGSASPASYVTLAGFLADDELYINTAKSACNAYLGVEFNFVTGIDVPSCGGRAPSYDVVDYSYSMLTEGLAGFDTATLQPKVHDDPTSCRAGSAANDPTCANHPPAGTSDTAFPFLAAPH